MEEIATAIAHDLGGVVYQENKKKRRQCFRSRIAWIFIDNL
jgi:hypothetical protein